MKTFARILIFAASAFAASVPGAMAAKTETAGSKPVSTPIIHLKFAKVPGLMPSQAGTPKSKLSKGFSAKSPPLMIQKKPFEVDSKSKLLKKSKLSKTHLKPVTPAAKPASKPDPVTTPTAPSPGAPTGTSAPTASISTSAPAGSSTTTAPTPAGTATGSTSAPSADGGTSQPTAGSSSGLQCFNVSTIDCALSDLSIACADFNASMFTSANCSNVTVQLSYDIQNLEACGLNATIFTTVNTAEYSNYGVGGDSYMTDTLYIDFCDGVSETFTATVSGNGTCADQCSNSSNTYYLDTPPIE